MLEEVKQLIPGSGDSSFPRPEADGNLTSSRASIQELAQLDNLVKMAKVLQEVAVSLAPVSSQLSSWESFGCKHGATTDK